MVVVLLLAIVMLVVICVAVVVHGDGRGCASSGGDDHAPYHDAHMYHHRYESIYGAGRVVVVLQCAACG